MQNWILPCRLRDYCLIQALDELKSINWKQATEMNNATVGDIVYFYLTTPDKRIGAKCIITKVNVPNSQLLKNDDKYYKSSKFKNRNNEKSLEIKCLQIYDKGLFLFQELEKYYNFRAPRRPSSISDEVVSYIEATAPNNQTKEAIINSDNESSPDAAVDEGIVTDKQVDTYELQVERDNPSGGYSVESLAWILKDMYASSDSSRKKTTVFNIFGIKYADVIKGFSLGDIVDKTGLGGRDTYAAEIQRGIRIAKAIEDGLFGLSLLKEEQQNSVEDKELPHLEPRERREDDDYLNTILYGAPGTGKTYALTERAIAIIEGKSVDEVKTEAEAEADESGSARKKLVEKWNGYVKNGRIVFTTFHQNYSYEDFIQGLRPDPDKPGEVSFKEVDGVFKKIADKALHDASNKYVMVIDEINRANISKVFGELITLIEEDKRWGEENEMSVTLPSGERFAVPNNLYIIGTMNSSDKSISLLDAALRRRFVFEEMKPDYRLVENEEARSILTHLNNQLKRELKSSDLLIGHSYFIKVNTTEEIVSVLNRRIIPLLYEYFYDDEEKVRSVLNNALNGTRIEIVNQDNAGRIRVRVQVEQ